MLLTRSTFSLIARRLITTTPRIAITTTIRKHTSTTTTATASLTMSAPTKRKAHTALDEDSPDGKFVRVESSFRHHITKGGLYEPEAGRYHLYVSYACPWAHRTLIVRALKGLTDVIGLSVVHPTWQRTRPDDADDTHSGWMFGHADDKPLSNNLGHGSFPPTDVIPDPVNDFKCVRDIYESSNDTAGKYSVPVLYCKKTKTIVNNESSEIIRIFDREFNDFAKNPKLNFYPADLVKEIEAVNEWVYPTINNGVYKCGFAKKQAPYEEAFDELFASLDRLEALLETRRYTAGDRMTEADIRLVVTLFRFDEVYVVYFKCNKKMLHAYHNIINYVREIYQMEGVADTVNMYHIKTHYFTSHSELNTYAVVPKGYGAIEDFARPHDRASKKF